MAQHSTGAAMSVGVRYKAGTVEGILILDTGNELTADLGASNAQGMHSIQTAAHDDAHVVVSAKYYGITIPPHIFRKEGEGECWLPQQVLR